MSTVIKVEQLSKSYIIGHQQQGSYLTLRDELMGTMARAGKRLLHPFRSSSGQPILGTDNVEEFWALKDVSFDVKQGDRVGIIGRNGAGKSTLLKMLSRIVEPTCGSVRLKGRVASLLEVGTGFHPELTGRENIFLNGAILGMSRADIKRRFDEIVTFADIERFLDTPVKRYSSGMYVRLAFAVAAHLDPEILIVDEVLAVGDMQFQKKCLGKMEEVGQEGRTVLFVSHNIAAVRRLCSRIIQLKNGEKVFDGNVSQGVEHYLELDKREMNSFKWPPQKGPSLPSARLQSVSVCNQDSGLESEISTEKLLNVTIEFDVLQAAKVGTTVILTNSEGNMVFSSISNHEPNWHAKERPPGTYRSVCEIPANFLAPGKYQVSIGFWEGAFEQGFVEKDILCINLVEQGLVRGDLPYELSNIQVMPLLVWRSEKVE